MPSPLPSYSGHRGGESGLIRKSPHTPATVALKLAPKNLWIALTIEWFYGQLNGLVDFGLFWLLGMWSNTGVKFFVVATIKNQDWHNFPQTSNQFIWKGSFLCWIEFDNWFCFLLQKVCALFNAHSIDSNKFKIDKNSLQLYLQIRSMDSVCKLVTSTIEMVAVVSMIA